MGFWGAFSGSVIGGAKGSIIGALVGAVAGSWIEEKFVRPLFPRLRREPRESPSHHEVPCVHPLVREYAILGVDVEASDEEVKSAYYSLAKSFHPDVMKADGLTAEQAERASQRMALINDAWAKIKKSRGI
ncbi:MAG: DnaJ domain-containing protein [Kiritimatiellae bacterium]|nr:DnaJ domain-containing protein [Kiritimatiellia bacterium]